MYSEDMTSMKPKPDKTCHHGEISFRKYSSFYMLQIRWPHHAASTEEDLKCYCCKSPGDPEIILTP